MPFGQGSQAPTARPAKRDRGGGRFGRGRVSNRRVGPGHASGARAGRRPGQLGRRRHAIFHGGSRAGVAGTGGRPADAPFLREIPDTDARARE